MNNRKLNLSKALMVFFTSLALTLGAALPANAQDGSTQSDQMKLTGPRKQLATIIFAGLGGAVLGLSTLSFYGRPQDKLINIAIGGAVGVMAGTVYVTYRAATNPQELFGQMRPEELPFERLEREQQERFVSQAPQVPTLGLQFDF